MVSLDLSHCEIKRVAAKAFNHVQALEKLYLNNNQIKEIKQKTVETIKGNLPQSSNPFIISLFLKFLLHWTVINSWKVPIKVFVQLFAATHIFQKASLTSNKMLQYSNYDCRRRSHSKYPRQFLCDFHSSPYSDCLKQFWHFKNEFQYFEIKLKDRGLILRQNLHNFNIFQTFCPSNILQIASNIKITNFCEKYMLFHQKSKYFWPNHNAKKITCDNPDQNRY